ncbi:uncharacterized protein LOC106659168 isoform X1 [Trichogramma pretiosum]|uniref:uncharacterized protein LOC106659168 isoform X1 n=1 Tax=Trichogramma pretiosum TaxID=7493 RepID=UPI0006C95F66|nr:uncharacterized protein LOC106659168 isoform X1 [Trichogramma pretiosum]
MRLSHQQSMRAADTTSQLSDDIEVEGICPSCRLAINKDTGRLKWCMGGSDMCRTRIRLLMLIPAVILPVAIIIIALSKSQVIGKLTTRGGGGGSPTKIQPSNEVNASLDEPRPSSSLQHHLIHDIEEAAELAHRRLSALHPHAVTSFLPASASLERHKRHANEGTGEESQEPQSISDAESSASPNERRQKQQHHQPQRGQQKNIIIASSRPSSAPGTLKSSLPTAVAARELQFADSS